MPNRVEGPDSGAERIVMAKKCLTLISKIASHGALSEDPDQIGYALQELTQVLCERTGIIDRLFEPIPADQIKDLNRLHDELDFVADCAYVTNGRVEQFRIVPVSLS